MQLLSLPFHHGEPSDPALLDWVNARVHDLLALGPVAAAALFGALIIAVPLVVLVFAVRRNRKASREAQAARERGAKTPLPAGEGLGEGEA